MIELLNWVLATSNPTYQSRSDGGEISPPSPGKLRIEVLFLLKDYS